MLLDHFAGVPEFPLAHCRAVLSHSLHPDDSVATAVEQIQATWREFVDKWGYYGSYMTLLRSKQLLHWC